MNHLSATAHLVAMYRALETERSDALFQDPLARCLAGSQGAISVEVLGGKHQGTTAMAIRTCAIDAMLTNLIQADRVDTVLNLGAGLDTRPYRLALPRSLHWIEVDLPDILRYKAQKLEYEQPICSLERIELDLIDRATRKTLFMQINSTANQVLVITEGLLPYLTETQVATLAADLHQQSNFRWWLFELAAAYILQQAQISKHQQRFDQYFANGNATFLFAPEQGTEFFRSYGWTVKEFRSLLGEARRLRRQSCFVRFGGLPMRWFARSAWRAITQQTGFALLERMV